MIKNERQYRITQARAEEFRQGIAQSERERREYDELKSGRRKVLTYGSFDELPKALVQARIARGWTQKDLADRLGLDEQKIQDYEATDYQRASLARIRKIVHALKIEIREEVKF